MWGGCRQNIDDLDDLDDLEQHFMHMWQSCPGKQKPFRERYKLFTRMRIRPWSVTNSFAGILQTHILSPLFPLCHSNDKLWIYNILFVAKYYLGCLLVLILSVFILFLKVNGVNLLKVHANWLMVACY